MFCNVFLQCFGGSLFKNRGWGDLEGGLRILKLQRDGLGKHRCHLRSNVWPFTRTHNILELLQRCRHLLIEEIVHTRFVALVFILNTYII